ncbi:DUF3619 family protein [Variovorax terrae]|uniref:DUF3619 family protein n=1 Tax=Variovorax terrae TaxID=2923278 RepID=A0A9X1VUD7_9BURK|nr:DUF3619 family protein [Variovorax terrae]MCJ0763110.1 DUF3619 family protein [Variovorax terrae]
MLQDRYGLKVAARLSAGTGELPHDISERLRAARVRAVAQRKVARVRTASSVVASGGSAALTFGDEGLSLWSRIASALPLIALVAGLVAINMVQNENRANEVAEVDAALLTDDLPPSAYADPGFAQFIKTSRDQNF